MIIEVIRYFGTEADRDRILQARREVSQIRVTVGLDSGSILIADPVPDDGPCLVWQCAYEDESSMGLVETSLMNNPEYQAAREQLTTLVQRVEVEFYESDETD